MVHGPNESPCPTPQLGPQPSTPHPPHTHTPCRNHLPPSSSPHSILSHLRHQVSLSQGAPPPTLLLGLPRQTQVHPSRPAATSHTWGTLSQLSSARSIPHTPGDSLRRLTAHCHGPSPRPSPPHRGRGLCSLRHFFAGASHGTGNGLRLYRMLVTLLPSAWLAACPFSGSRCSLCPKGWELPCELQKPGGS